MTRRLIGLFDTVREFHQYVEVDRKLTQTEFARLKYGGNGKGNGNLLKTLSYAHYQLGVQPGTRKWSYLEQEAGRSEVGELLRMSKREALAQLDRNMCLVAEEEAAVARIRAARAKR